MAKVIVFPQKERLPKGLEKEVHRLAKEYIEVLYASLNLLAGNEMVAVAYAEGLIKSIDELE